ncbi:putative membrane protein (TIGR02226 family) [Rhodovulum imhoffii]|uniref:Putative membrane protein (TIGR02226 family) n=1 Tax=Rhodovulum imhoffii TaxID=365340 RepID=A0A2T5BS42_9RHOB|nr:DUF4159 domain-containing protein [Rhodovulum imhoffii]MBK5934695.1 LytTR family transcriptional regulator [Rhodovulum imhoffii]PTN02118.1 putative membrane protein (TIGR02226 family) [Rhodovulum imhoffii]
MTPLGPIAFGAPGVLWALLALPVLWVLLRAVPPAPVRRRFPGVALLLGLSDETAQTSTTPWWLLLLRMLAVAAAILGFAGPVVNPQPAREGRDPLLIYADGGWADARDWPRRQERIRAELQQAARAGRPVAVVLGTDLPAEPFRFEPAESWLPRLAGLGPAPWMPGQAPVDWARALEGDFETLWLSAGLETPERAGLLAVFQARGDVRVHESPRPLFALRPPEVEGGGIALTVLRARPGADAPDLRAIGVDPAGQERELAHAAVRFAPGARQAKVVLSLPPELRNRVARFALAGVPSAGAVALADDSLQRRKVALIAAREDREGLRLLSPLYYLEKALMPSADLLSGRLTEVIQAGPDVIILADIAAFAPTEAEALAAWVTQGGLLVRFAGPRLAARGQDGPLLPVPLRAGGRSLGGAMSWGTPRGLQPFPEGSVFHGLPVPDEVGVRQQVLAQPGPELAGRTLAALSDGTPLVTRKALGQGQVVLFHVTANAEWSSLPLSGLFVQMLERLVVSMRPAIPGQAAPEEGTVWVPQKVLTAFGGLEATDTLAGVDGARFAKGPGPGMPPGLYAGPDRRIALNVIAPGQEIAAPRWPASIPVEQGDARPERALKGPLLLAALGLLALDVLAALALTGRLRVAVLLLAIVLPVETRADEAGAVAATAEVTLAHVRTGDPRVDDIARAGLEGLSRVLTLRTAVEPGPPVAVDPETDELAFYPLLYWPVTASQPLPSGAAYERLVQYLRGGGMILFDTRDADIAGLGGASPEARRLRQVAAPLDIPPLEPVPGDHVLTRAFYLLQDFPGRHPAAPVWVEVASLEGEQAEDIPFRTLNDGVSPVVIGGGDWATAWAVDARGVPLYPVGRGYGGERQREMAYRFGVNLVMYVLTGNYKSDQVHVPALLERLGQ